jgi:hypothetical protein
MSDAEAGIGGGLELGPISLKAIVDLQAGMTSIAKAFSDWKDEEAYYQYGAVDITLTGSGTADEAEDDLVFGLEGPPEGYMWEILSLSIGGVSPVTATLEGVAYFFRGATRPIGSPAATTGNQLSTMNWIDWTGAGGAVLPATAFYSTRQIVLHAPDRLWCVISAPETLTQYVVNGHAIETPDRRRKIVTDQ